MFTTADYNGAIYSPRAGSTLATAFPKFKNKPSRSE